MLGRELLTMFEDEASDVTGVKARNHWLRCALFALKNVGPFQDRSGGGGNLREVARRGGTFQDGAKDVLEDFGFDFVRVFFLFLGEGETHDSDAPGAIVLLQRVDVDLEGEDLRISVCNHGFKFLVLG